MALATTTDVETSLMRPLTTVEQQYVPGLLDRAEQIISVAVPGALDRAETDAAYEALLIQVEAEMVARVLRNPTGMKNESDGTYSYSIDWSVASGRLKLLDDDLTLLGANYGIGSLAGEMDGYARARYGLLAPQWQFQYGWPGQDSIAGTLP